MITYISFGKCGKWPTIVSMRHDDGRWFHDAELSAGELQLLRWHVQEPPWRYVHLSITDHFIGVSFRRDGE